MALWADLMVNDERIGFVEAVRKRGSPDPDSINTYDWRRVVDPLGPGREIRTGELKHRYGDGAAVLLAKVLLESENK